MENKRLTVLEKALKVIQSTLEKTRRGVRNPSRKPITPKKARPARIAKRGSVRHKKVTPANRGITSFWRNENGSPEEVNVAENGQWSLNKTEDEKFHVHSWDYVKGTKDQLTTTPRTKQEIIDHNSFNPNKHKDWNKVQEHLRNNQMIAWKHKPKKDK